MIEVVAGNYRASKAGSFLEYLDMISDRRRDGGFLHSGHIHYIQGRCDGFILKAAIKGILDNVPDVFPLDLPEQIEKKGEIDATEKQVETVNEINEGLLIPIGAWEILEVIKLAREYEALDTESREV